jgi:hypothetical protein
VGPKQPTKLDERVFAAADTVLRACRSVSPLELLVEMRLLAPAHVTAWQKGISEDLSGCIQGSSDKLKKTFAFFEQWAAERQLKPIIAHPTRATPAGNVPLHVTQDADPERERFFCTYYVPETLTTSATERVATKLKKPTDLVVFQTVSDSVACSECGTEMHKGDFLFMEKKQPVCLNCADLDHLEFLPSGDATLTRRARKHSRLNAVVVRFARARNRYERQGILVTSEAVEAAERECMADEAERAARRPLYALRREKEDREFVAAMAKRILELYPACPPEEADRIARHTASRGSGRVGRSAAARNLEPEPLALAVTAWVRHNHTDYDDLLMQGMERPDARREAESRILIVLANWSGLGR